MPLSWINYITGGTHPPIKLGQLFNTCLTKLLTYWIPSNSLLRAPLSLKHPSPHQLEHYSGGSLPMTRDLTNPIILTLSLLENCQLSNCKILHWHTYRITTLLDLTSNQSSKSFRDLQHKCHLPDTDNYTYLWVNHFLKVSKLPSIVTIPETLHRFHSQPTHPKHGISVIYTALNDPTPKSLPSQNG